ncbi:hypothetical protein ACN28C_29435 [Plantactinospora sp. WMMC1484]|uniref:hypothetical protein n=1 Tax=Plantactinospora sp. WMMC1484 TaxID=3404122 RepID=UPI003BF5AC70
MAAQLHGLRRVEHSRCPVGGGETPLHGRQHPPRLDPPLHLDQGQPGRDADPNVPGGVGVRDDPVQVRHLGRAVRLVSGVGQRGEQPVEAHLAVQVRRVTVQAGPRTVQAGPRTVQAGPRTVQAGPRTVQAGPRTVQAGPRTVQAGPVMAGLRSRVGAGRTRFYSGL